MDDDGPIISKLDDKNQYNNYEFHTRRTFGFRADTRTNAGERCIVNPGFTDLGLASDWGLLVWCGDGHNYYVYHNGELIEKKEIGEGVSILPSSNVMRIGNGNDMNSSGRFYKGKLADLRIYDYCLSPDEIKNIFNNPSQGSASNNSINISNGPALASASPKLVAEYKLNGDCKDATGNGNNGNVVGDVSFADDSVFGKCAVFNGGYITVNSSPVLNLGRQFTISAWVMVDPSIDSGNQNGPIISKLDDRGNYNNYEFHTRGIFGFRADTRTKDGERCIVNQGFTDLGLANGWSQLVFCCDGKNYYVYHNGELIASKDIGEDATILPSGNVMRIGTGNDMNHDSLFYKGRMADLRIYNYCMSADEIKNISSNPNSGNITNSRGSIVLTVGQPSMVINGSSRDIDPGQGTAPEMMNGRVFVPIRAIVEAMGGHMGWSAANRQVTINRQGTVITLRIGSGSATVNGQTKSLDVQPYVSDTGRTMLPLRFVTENLGCRCSGMEANSRWQLVSEPAKNKDE